MSIRLTLNSCRIGDVAKPVETSEDYEDEDSFYESVSMTETEKNAVFQLLRDAWSHHDEESGFSRYRLETPDGPVTIRATGLRPPDKFPHVKVALRSLTARTVGLVFALMRDGNLFMLPEFDQGNRVTVSEEQRRYVAEHIPIAQVCSTPEELQRYLSERMEDRRRVKPNAFKDNWADLADDAEAAGRILLQDRAAGEQEFQRLFAVDPENGMLYLIRGRAYETLGERALAAAEYRKALEFFPEGDLFRDRVLRALARVTN
jgi:tetratricopeptide (TPR) repeat protein